MCTLKRAIIIGGSGFLGKATAKLLLDTGEFSVVSLDIQHNNLSGEEHSFVDIRNPITFQFNPDDIVIHLAANQYHAQVPRKGREDFFYNTNTIGTKNVLKRMRECGCSKLVYFSTDMVYGLPESIPVQVNHVQKPFGPYGRSKMLSEKICLEYREHGIDVTIFRPRMIVGPGRYGILRKLFSLIRHDFPVPLIGSGETVYQMVAVTDCAEAILRAIQCNIPNKVYNLGSLNPPTVSDLLQTVIKKAGSRSILIPTYGKAVKAILAALGFLGLEVMYKEQYAIADQYYIIDISETVNDLNWTPKHDDASMLCAAYDSYINLKKNTPR